MQPASGGLDVMTGLWESMSDDPTRQAWAWGSAAAFGLVCLWAGLKGRKPNTVTSDYLVLYASQTGQAEEIARNSARALSAGGLNAQALSTAQVSVAQLQAARTILCVISTTGEGDAPDEGLRFEQSMMQATPDISAQTVAVLALGDSNYDAYCAFGRRVFDWLVACGAQPIQPVIEVDDLEPAALKRWDDLIHALGGKGDSAAEAGVPWRLDRRTRLNPLGDNPLYHLSFVTDQVPSWQAGDLIEIVTPHGHRRDYSVASLPEEGRIDLYVREVVKSDGSYGDGSGLLIHGLQTGDSLPLRLKSHRNFHAPEGEGPLLLIGAGSGLAGLRAHILQAAKTGRPVWLIYGERHPVRDGALTEAMTTWRDEGTLQALDIAYSRPDDGKGRYVQAVVAARAEAVKGWLERAGAVMCCGGLAMGLEVESALVGIMGQAWVDEAKVSGRYRRDLY
jgi:sulfite reductase (NADPH) flavoprotein alpha-component